MENVKKSQWKESVASLKGNSQIPEEGRIHICEKGDCTQKTMSDKVELPRDESEVRTNLGGFSATYGKRILPISKSAEDDFPELN